MPDPYKVSAVVDWLVPTTAKELGFFVFFSSSLCQSTLESLLVCIGYSISIPFSRKNFDLVRIKNYVTYQLFLISGKQTYATDLQPRY